ncbi:MAG: hypothetical protein SOT45_00430 [Treponema sp.]|nr:hypothetical protein [Treponema sp.]
MIKIDIDTRYWQIPKEECFLGVESDDKVKILRFELSKNEFCGGLNFTDCNCFINYKNEGNDTIPYLITDMEVQEDGTVTFTWEVSRGATIFKGNTLAILCAKMVSDDGTITNEWNSRIGSFTVAKGLEPLSSITEVPEIDIISQLLSVAQQTNANAQTNIDKSSSLLEKAEGLREQVSELKGDLGEKETAITDIQKKMSDSNSNDGFLLCDLNGNVVGHIASLKVWDNESYNKKYGWGGHPYGNGKLPPYSKIAGVFEADLLSVCGGKGRWNKEDTGNFQHGGHLFEGWNAEEDVRLTFGIGTKNKEISWIQTFHPATQEGSDSGAYHCITKIGSDIDNQGVNFMPSIAQSKSLFSLKVGNNLSPKSEHIQKLVETGELVDWEYNKNDMVPYGTMYFDYDKDKVRVYTRTGGWKYLKFEEEV